MRKQEVKQVVVVKRKRKKRATKVVGGVVQRRDSSTTSVPVPFGSYWTKFSFTVFLISAGNLHTIELWDALYRNHDTLKYNMQYNVTEPNQRYILPCTELVCSGVYKELNTFVIIFMNQFIIRFIDQHFIEIIII